MTENDELEELEKKDIKENPTNKEPISDGKDSSKTKEKIPMKNDKKPKKSYYKVIKGEKYDRELLESAIELSNKREDGILNLDDFKKLWEEAQDSAKVTKIELKTLQYVLNNLSSTDSAKEFLSDKLSIKDKVENVKEQDKIEIKDEDKTEDGKDEIKKEKIEIVEAEKVEIVDKKKLKKMKIKPQLDDDIKEALKKRAEIKKRKPKFRRQEWFRYKKLGDKWRKPKGLHSKMRRNLKYRPNCARVGYGSPKIVRDLHPSGFKEVLIHNLNELEKINPKNQAARIAHSVGFRKRENIIERADEKGIRILNRGV